MAFKGLVLIITQWVHNLRKIALALTVIEIKMFFISANIQDGGQKSEKFKFFRSPKGVIVLGYLVVPKFVMNHSISYSFQDKQPFLFPPNSRWRPKF